MCDIIVKKQTNIFLEKVPVRKETYSIIRKDNSPKTNKATAVNPLLHTGPNSVRIDKISILK